MLRKIVTRRFSINQDPLLQKLLIKVPKEVEIDVGAGFLTFLFEQTKKYTMQYTGHQAICS